MKNSPSGAKSSHLIEIGEPRSLDALLLIDVINDFDFPESRKLLRPALTAAKRIAALKARARRNRIPVIYINDNFGRWRSDFRKQVHHCLEKGCMGRPIAKLLKPDDEDYFILKPMHSGFYSTSLHVLLERLGSKRLILTGFATDLCVLYTANDAYMRHYKLCVPKDCVAAESTQRSTFALKHLKDQLKADIRIGTKIRFSK